MSWGGGGGALLTDVILSVFSLIRVGGVFTARLHFIYADVLFLPSSLLPGMGCCFGEGWSTLQRGRGLLAGR